MKKYLLLLLIFACVLSFAQNVNYITKRNVLYYGDSLNKSDAYIRELCNLDLYYPTNERNFTTIVWFHGGGLTSGNKEIPEALTNQGFCVVGVGYRLVPNVSAPKYIEDAAAAIAWVFKNIAQLGGDTTKIFVSGHSAGAYLTAMVGLDKKWLKAEGVDANRIAGLIPLSAQVITHFEVRKEKGLPETQPFIDALAPLFHIRADAPPMLLITGDREMEMLGRYEENAYLMRMMKVVGHSETKLIELKGYGHQMTEPAFPLLLQEVRRIGLLENK